MITNMRQSKWVPVETSGWLRRAYGRTIKYESEGGTLRCRLPGSQAAAGQLYLRLDVTGRMLVQVFCNEAMVFEDLVAHGELDTFVDLRPDPLAEGVEIELHLIPATNGEVRIGQDVQFVRAKPVVAAMKTEAFVIS